jgi:hypothetical protein
MENLNFVAYWIYLFFVIALTLIVAHILFRNSLNFMNEIFQTRPHLAESTNRLFRIGFFLLAFGIGLWYLKIDTKLLTRDVLFEILSVKVGAFTLFLGGLLFGNLYLFFRGMRASRKNRVMEPKA